MNVRPNELSVDEYFVVMNKRPCEVMRATMFDNRQISMETLRGVVLALVHHKNPVAWLNGRYGDCTTVVYRAVCDLTGKRAELRFNITDKIAPDGAKKVAHFWYFKELPERSKR